MISRIKVSFFRHVLPPFLILLGLASLALGLIGYTVLVPFTTPDPPIYTAPLVILAGILAVFAALWILSILLGSIFPGPDERMIQKIQAWDHQLRLRKGTRGPLFLLLLTAGVGLIFFGNTVFASIDEYSMTFESKDTIPLITPVGWDFRTGLYEPMRFIFFGEPVGYNDFAKFEYPSIYPPFVNLFSLPYAFLNVNSAYILHVFLLLSANLFSMILAAAMVKQTIFMDIQLSPHNRSLVLAAIFSALLFYLLSGYPFAFSIERGNVDAFGMFFALLSMWLLIKKPGWIWAQVILLSIAAHLKIYPAILFLILLYKHGKKMILPAILTNLVLFFCLGPNIAFGFIYSMTAYTNQPNAMIWIGNHSAHAFAVLLTQEYRKLDPAFSVLQTIFTLLPILLWGVMLFLIWRKRANVSTPILFFMASVPVMELLPSFSNDYKLIILAPALVILVSILFKTLLTGQGRWDFLQLILLVGLMGLLSRSPALNEHLSTLINNKYLWVLALEILMIPAVARYLRLPEENATTCLEGIPCALEGPGQQPLSISRPKIMNFRRKARRTLLKNTQGRTGR